MIRLGVDVGERRLGFAICDADEIVASPLKVVEVKSPLEAAKAVQAMVKETGAEEIVVGLPRNMNGKLGVKGKEAERFAEGLREDGYRVVLWDERLTTVEAERSLRTAELSRKERKRHLDAVAAQRILSSYLAQLPG